MTLRTPRTLLAVWAFVPVTLLSVITAHAHAQEQLWITQFGTSSDETAEALASDGAGGVFVCGWTQGSLGGSSGGYDPYLARHDGAGEVIWIRQFGSPFSDFALALASDGSGGVFVCGYTWGNLGGPTAGPFDAILARYDSAGNQLWIHQFGTNEHDLAWALASDGSGGVFVGGFTIGSLGGPSAGGQDAYVAHYDGVGNVTWIRQFGTIGTDLINALASDGAGGVFVGGWTNGSLGGPNAGGRDAFVAHHNSAGQQMWIKQFGTGAKDYAFALASDGSGGVYVCGWTEGSLGGPSAGSEDAYLAHYDNAGNRTWIRQFGTSGDDEAWALAPDGMGGVYVSGSTTGRLGGLNAGQDDVFLGHYDAVGTQSWILQFGTSNHEEAMGLAADGAGGVYVAGETDGDFGGLGAGGLDAFLARFTDGFCYADCDPNSVLDIFDFLCFQNSFVLGEPYACECDPDPACNIFDFLCFQNAFVNGCP